MLILTFFIKTLIELYIILLLLRIWMQWTRCDLYNPFSQFIVKITQPIIELLLRTVSVFRTPDTASLLLAFILAMIKFPLLMLIETQVLITDPICLLVGLLALLKAVGKLVFWVVVIRSLLSWFSQGRSSIDIVLYQLSESVMYYIRRILPVMGGIDFSAMIIILILYAMNYLGMDLFPGIWYHI